MIALIAAALKLSDVLGGRVMHLLLHDREYHVDCNETVDTEDFDD